jgi:hypothetical protein
MATTSPNTANYTVGKGNVYIKRAGVDASRRHMGNVLEMEFTPELEKLEHFSSMEGVKERDKSVVISKKGSLRIVYDEMSPENHAIALMGAISEGGSGGDVNIDIFSESEITCELWYEGNNDIGPKYNAYFGSVSFIPSGALPFISEEWMTVEITGDVNKVNNTFGTLTKVADGA